MQWEITGSFADFQSSCPLITGWGGEGYIGLMLGLELSYWLGREGIYRSNARARAKLLAGEGRDI